MALTGDLTDLDIADLIQLTCQSGDRARLIVRRDDLQIAVYFDAGEIVHAQAGETQGEEAVYELISWEAGTFEMDQDVAPPAVTINVPWSALVMEGMRLRDERNQSTDRKDQEAMSGQTKAERLRTALRNMVENSLDIRGVAVITLDGLIVAAALPAEMEQARVGAVAAGIMSLSRRSIDQLKSGQFDRTLVQGSDANVVLTPIGKDTAFVALTGKEANLGMVFLELREGVETVQEILG